MSTDFEFEPFTDYAKITDEMVQDAYAAIRELDAAKDHMTTSPSPASLERLLKAHDDVNDTMGAIGGALWTIPVMVHTVGERQEELLDPDDPSSDTIIMQRCVRCKSPLAGWRPNLVAMTKEGPKELEPDEVHWWEVGKRFAKATMQDQTLGGYIIEPDDRALERHERECVGFDL